MTLNGLDLVSMTFEKNDSYQRGPYLLKKKTVEELD